jgi:hypothetical protein
MRKKLEICGKYWKISCSFQAAMALTLLLLSSKDVFWILRSGFLNLCQDITCSDPPTS